MSILAVHSNYTNRETLGNGYRSKLFPLLAFGHLTYEVCSKNDGYESPGLMVGDAKMEWTVNEFIHDKTGAAAYEGVADDSVEVAFPNKSGLLHCIFPLRLGAEHCINFILPNNI